MPAPAPVRSPWRAPFSVMVKPVGSRCNLRCSYCYYLPTPHAGPARMTDALLERFVRQYLAASPGPEVSFVWHGGEPTLAGLDFYRRAVELQQRYLPAGWVCWNNLQTNGVLLDDEWCAFLAEHHFDVGLSIDGTRAIHDQYRPDPRGAGSFAAAAGAIRRLKAHGVRPDLLCTVTSTTAAQPLAVYRTLRSFDTGWIQFIPIVNRDAGGRVTPESVDGAAYGDFLCAIFDEWAWHDLGRLDVQLFAETGRTLAGGAPGVCWLAPTCGRVLVVESDGGVYSCDHYVTPAHRLGDLGGDGPGGDGPGGDDLGADHLGADNPGGHDLGDMVDSDAQRRFGEAKRDHLAARCLACPWLALCRGGCPKDRSPAGAVLAADPAGGPADDERLTGVRPGVLADDDRLAGARSGALADEPNVNYLCDGLARFFAHAVPPLRQMVELTRRGTSPTAIMATLRAQAMAQWHGVGLNDRCPCGSGRRARACCWSTRPR